MWVAEFVRVRSPKSHEVGYPQPQWIGTLTRDRDIVTAEVPAYPVGEADKLRWHHDDSRGVLLGANLGDHLHAPQFEAEWAVGDLAGGLS